MKNRTTDALQSGIDMAITPNTPADNTNSSSTVHQQNSNGQNNVNTQNQDNESVTVQLGAYNNEENAINRQNQYGGHIVYEDGLYKVQKDFDSLDDAKQFVKTVKDKDVWIKKKK